MAGARRRPVAGAAAGPGPGPGRASAVVRLPGTVPSTGSFVPPHIDIGAVALQRQYASADALADVLRLVPPQRVLVGPSRYHPSHHTSFSTHVPVAHRFFVSLVVGRFVCSAPGDGSFSMSSSMGSLPAGVGNGGGSVGSVGSGVWRAVGGTSSSAYYANGEPKKGKGRGKMSEAAARHLNSSSSTATTGQPHKSGGGGMVSVSASMINELQKEFFGRL